MNLKNRLYTCKNEELLPVSKFTLFSLRRDLAEFAGFSTQFNDEYVAQTEALINTVDNLLEPQAETLALKQIYQAMEQQLTELQHLLLRLEGYLKLCKNVPGLTPAAFGVTTLRKSLFRGDFEGVLKGLKLLISNVQNHLVVLQGKGLPAGMQQTLLDLHNSIADNKQKQFEIKSNRAGIVQNNQQVLNELYLRLSEIYTIGKVLYKNTNAAKLADYTFSALLKKVRNTSKKSDQPLPTA